MDRPERAFWELKPLKESVHQLLLRIVRPVPTRVGQCEHWQAAAEELIELISELNRVCADAGGVVGGRRCRPGNANYSDG
jgi:hypothetical protein